MFVYPYDETNTQFKWKKRVTRDRIYMELWLTLDRIWILHQSLHSEKWSDKHVLFTAWLIGLGNENVQVSRDQLGNNIFYNTQKSFCNVILICSAFAINVELHYKIWWSTIAKSGIASTWEFASAAFLNVYKTNLLNINHSR